jgi:hypothetical protein
MLSMFPVDLLLYQRIDVESGEKSGYAERKQVVLF